MLQILRIPSLVAGVIWVIWAVVVYWRLRCSSAVRAETDETRRWICVTPPFMYFAPMLVAALPLLAEMTCIINALLWPVEMAIRPWRHRHTGPRQDG
jgi:hypothetical protein